MGFDFTAARVLCAELQSHAKVDPMDLESMGARLQSAMTDPATRRFVAAYMGRSLTGSCPNIAVWEPPSF